MERYNRAVPWSDHFVTEIKSGLSACQVMCVCPQNLSVCLFLNIHMADSIACRAWFVLFYLGLNQITNNLVSQAGQMELTGFPNDSIQVLNPIACVIIGPVMQKVLYPALAALHIPFGPLVRMSISFIIMSSAFAYAAGVQKMIYDSGPCYMAPLACVAAQREGQPPLPNSIKVWVQTPVYVILALAEILGFVTLAEYIYTKAPKDMRTVVNSVQEFSACIGSAIGIALGPVSQDPKILWTYVGLAASMGLMSPLFWLVMGHLERDNQDVNTIFLETRQANREEVDPIPVHPETASTARARQETK